MADPKEKFAVICDGLKLIEWLVKPLRLAEFVQKHLDSLDENELKNFVQQARLGLRKDLGEVMQDYIAMYDKREAATLAPRARAI